MSPSRNPTLLLLAIFVQCLIINTSPIGVPVNTNNDGLLFPLLGSPAPQTSSNDATFFNTALAAIPRTTTRGNLLTSLGIPSASLSSPQTASNNDTDLHCTHPVIGPVYVCEDPSNNAIVMVNRILPGQTYNSTLFSTLLDTVTHQIQFLISQPGSQGKETPQPTFSITHGNLTFRSDTVPYEPRVPTSIPRPPTLGNLLAAARVVRGENWRIGGAVTSRVLIWDGDDERGFQRVGVGGVGWP